MEEFHEYPKALYLPGGQRMRTVENALEESQARDQGWMHYFEAMNPEGPPPVGADEPPAPKAPPKKRPARSSKK